MKTLLGGATVGLMGIKVTMCASGLASVSPSKTTCLLPSPAGGVDVEVVSFLSHLKEFKQLRKMVMNECENLSPSFIATICEDLCSSNSMEDVEVTIPTASLVTREVSVLSVCITTPCAFFYK